ncbi:MvdC/MvdD family ATP grasp protein [Xanthomonas euvesicatoria]|uniref:MvdC/MvdD family ATP grasp protein n=1 Tax=Xanthomonas euvesicatoria TaxID=456327 RepID=UPI003A0FBE9E
MDTYKKAVLINSLDGDFHAAVLGQALSKRGSRVIRWNAEDYPTRSSVSIRYAERHADVRVSTGEHDFNEHDIGVVWNRRRRVPEVPKLIDVRDRQFAQMELDAAFHAHKSLFRKAFWINKGVDVPPILSSTSVWSPIPYPKEIGREEAFFRRTDHRLPARSRSGHSDQGLMPAAWLQ